MLGYITVSTDKAKSGYAFYSFLLKHSKHVHMRVLEHCSLPWSSTHTFHIQKLFQHQTRTVKNCVSFLALHVSVRLVKDVYCQQLCIWNFALKPVSDTSTSIQNSDSQFYLYHEHRFNSQNKTTDCRKRQWEIMISSTNNITEDSFKLWTSKCY